MAEKESNRKSLQRVACSVLRQAQADANIET